MPTVLITGSSRGLGFEFARQYATDGFHVIATCRTPDEADDLQKLARQHPNLQIEALNVADASSIAALAEKLKETPVDILINNAGIVAGDEEPVWINPDKNNQQFGNIDATEWDRVLRVNTIAPVMMTQAFLSHLKKSKNPKVIMLSSRCGSISNNIYPKYVAYSTSKAALNMAMRNIATTIKGDNIIVISINPGFVKTYMGGEKADISPDTSVSGIRQVIANLTIEQTGQFLRYTGETVPW